MAVLAWRYLGAQHQEQFNDVEAAAQYGDSFGFANSLFSGLAFAGVVAALIIQSMEYTLATGERTGQLGIQRDISDQQGRQLSTQEQIAKTQASIQIESNKVQMISVLS